MNRLACYVAIVVLVWAGPALAAGTATYDEEVLANGLRVILIPHRANPMVASAVVVGAGVVQEPPEASGASHFLEHLLFNGTGTRTQRQLYDDVDRLGAYNNATTREDHTLFTLLVAKDFAEQGLAIQADMLFRSTIPEANFEKERKIVLEELARDRSDRSYDIEAAFRASAYAGTPLARPVLGTEASLAGISRDQVVRYYKSRYVPSNMTLIVMGDFDIAEMRAAVGRTFGAATKAPPPAAPSGSWPGAPELNLVVAPVESGPARLLAAFPLPVDPWTDTMAATEVLLAAAGDGEDSPLVRALTRAGITPIAVSLAVETRARPWSTVVLDATLPAGADPKVALDALAEAIRQTAAGGEARDRIERVRAQDEADAAIARDQIHYYAMLRSSLLLGAPEGFLAGEAKRVGRLGDADWDAASSRLQAGLTQVRARFAVPGATATAIAWTPPPAPAAVATPPWRVGALSNGLRYAVRASGDSTVFAMHIGMTPRSAAEPAGQDGITDLLHRMMVRGTIVRDEAGVQERLAELGARLKVVDDPSVPFDDYYTTPEYSWMRLEVPAANWREAVGLVSEILRFPSLTQAALDESRREMLELVTKNAASPRGVAVATLDALLAPGNPLTRPVIGTKATLDAITLGALKAHEAATIVGRRTIIAAVGPVGPEAVVRALTSGFGGLPEGTVADPPAPPPVATTPATASVALGKSQAYLAMGDVLEVAESDRAPLAIAVSMLSDRLAFDLRETKGLAYAIGASVRPWGRRMRFDVTIGTRAENLDAARTGIVDGIRAFVSETPGAADVARAVNVVRGAALMRRMTRISLAAEAGLEILRGREPGDERRFIDSLRTVTAEGVNRVARAYLDPDRLSQVVVR